MRVDIKVDENTGEIEELKSLKNITFGASVASEDASYIYLDLIIDDGLEVIIETDGVGVSIDRLDSVKLLKLKITNASVTFDTGYIDLKNTSGELLTASMLPLVNDEFKFVVIYNSTLPESILYSGYTYDIILQQSLHQNEYFLIFMDKGNLYEHPLSGVAIRDYLNAVIERSDLAINIKSELEDDRMVVKQINYDTRTKEILTQTQEL